MNQNDSKHHPTYSPFKGLGKWYSWDTPVGLSLGFSITLLSIGGFLFLLRKSGLL